MKKFEILPHPSDLKIRIFGKTKKELFSNALFAMAKGQEAELAAPLRTTERKIKIQSLDFPALLVDFLSEVLYLSQTNKEIYKEVKFSKFSDNEIEGEIIGGKVKRFGEDVKAVTYHNLDVSQNKKGIWEATILFDV